jgi:cobalt/nickel transport system permease protein
VTVGGPHSISAATLEPVERSTVRRAAPQCRIAATVLFVVAVVATPKEAWWAFLVHAVLLASVARRHGVRARAVLRHVRLEAPFLAFAALLPFVAGGDRVDVLGVDLSRAGLWAAANIVVKATLGVAAAAVLASTTSVPELLVGLERLRVPRVLVAITGSMLRHAAVVTDELQRMRIARLSRAYDPRWLWQARAVAAGAGTLFVRSYERGERVFVAMAARGFDGALPPLGTTAATRREWATALAVPAATGIVAVLAWAWVA